MTNFYERCPKCGSEHIFIEESPFTNEAGDPEAVSYVCSECGWHNEI